MKEVLGMLQLIALLRYPKTVAWGTAVTTIYVLFIATFSLAEGIGCWLTARHWHWKIAEELPPWRSIEVVEK